MSDRCYGLFSSLNAPAAWAKADDIHDEQAAGEAALREYKDFLARANIK